MNDTTQTPGQAELLELLACALSRLDRAALEALVAQGTGAVRPRAELALLMEARLGEPVSEGTIHPLLARLAAVGLLASSRGPRGGYQATELGRRLLAVLESVEHRRGASA
jgi:predicted transcriptional regulator